MNLLFHALGLMVTAYLFIDFEGVMAVNLSGMRKLYKEGSLTAAIVAPALLENGWVLIVKKKDGTSDHMTIARSPRHKIYKSLESAHLDAMRVGFSEVTTQVGELQVA
ncbi:plasmid replication protein RepB [Pseudomonas corrugata]|uniref:plasmid replication protein RepB n=1 Tax=Pseudomonas corrugata TaxID=47879 RepID=UPI001F525BA3|nr:plasmid replication protein RepB [Pseudomonas corrugata]